MSRGRTRLSETTFDPTLMQDRYIRDLFSDPEMLRMGHFQRQEDLNLGLGWIYYALGRVIRPARAVVIGSYRGFVPSVLAKSLMDNAEGGEVSFIDPSYVDDFWADAKQVETHFRKLGTPNVRHFRHTTQDFMATPAYAELSDIGLLMIDGHHTAEQARLDYLAFLGKLTDNAIVLFHDSVRQKISPIYGKDNPYTHTVCMFMDRLKGTPGLEVFTLPYADGLTLVQGRPETLEVINQPFDLSPP
ncbi:MAG: class I SAM-dependent methyltransferase [Alphaproteobacteria bacterium]